MTDTSEAVVEAEPASSEPTPPAPETPPAPPVDRGRVLWFVGAVAAVVAVVCGLALPFAPVVVNSPTVTWPRDPAVPESTLLQLTAHRPLELDVRFSCDVARLAPLGATATDPRGVVVATALPALPIAAKLGMTVTVTDGLLEVRAFDETVLAELLPDGPCEYRITGTSAGLPSYVRPPDPNNPVPPDLSRFAQPGNAQLTITRDGGAVADRAVEQLPDVDMLATTVPPLPAALAGQLSVSLRVDDEFTTAPAPSKIVLIVLVALALLVTLVVVLLADRTVARVPVRWRPRLPRVVDGVVPAVIVWWMFLAPATDDDGYYAAMAQNAAITGRVGNYYQLYDQNFTPFTWFYQALGAWQQLVGLSPVAQRIPAVVFGILTWIVLRRFVVAAMAEWAPDRRGVRVVAHAVLAVVYLAWWVALDMGVRPETVVALCAASVLLAVLAARRRKRLVYAWLAALIAGLGFVAHPTGFTLFAPLLAGIPLLWPLLRAEGSPAGPTNSTEGSLAGPRTSTASRVRTGLRLLTVAAAGMVAPLVAFYDGSLRDFLRGQLMFLSIQAQDGWYSEYQRYFFLLSNIPMGNFAKRAAVLACLVALVWFAVLAAAARLRRVPLPTPLWLAGSATALAFLLLWLTPSKWSHHFGSLAGIGSAFLALFLVTVVPLTRRVLARDAVQDPERETGSRIPAGIAAAAAVSTVLAIALAWHGPNDWPYAWLEGVRRAYLPPAVVGVEFDSLPLWFVLFALVAVVCALWARRRGSDASGLRLGPERDLRLAVLRAAPVVLVCSLVGTTAFTVLTFAEAAVAQTPREAVWSDPTAADCTAAGPIRVADPDSAQPLPPAVGPAVPPAPTRFLAGSGYYLGNPPQGTGGAQLWGSLADFDPAVEPNAERNTGEMTTGWYALPATAPPDTAPPDTAPPDTAPPDTATTFLASGTLTDGNSVTAEYGFAAGSLVVPVGEEQEFTDPDRGTVWRTFTLAPPPSANVVRITAVDGTAGAHGWLAFTAPAQSRVVPMSTLMAGDPPVALAWQIAFGFPCQRQPVVRDGITESVRYGVLYGDVGAPISAFGDGVWQEFRGGLFAQVPRSHSMQQLAVIGRVDPHLFVYEFGSTMLRDAYTVTTTSRTQTGASTATG